MTTPIPAVLVNVDGIERWCTRDVSHLNYSGRAVDPYVYAYTDVLTGVRFATAKCREIREGAVRVIVEEVSL